MVSKSRSRARTPKTRIRALNVISMSLDSDSHLWIETNRQARSLGAECAGEDFKKD